VLSRRSRKATGRATFGKIEGVLRLAEEEGRRHGPAERFELTIVD
jgi:hypothetical protein